MPTVECGFDDSAGASGSQLLVFSGPTLLVDIGFDPAYRPDPPGMVPRAAITGQRALVDTGASVSCIDGGLAMQLNLPIVDRQPISGIGGTMIANLHLAQIHIPSLNVTVYGNFAAVDLIAGGQAHYALIGRTFLMHIKMTYNGLTGKVVISNDP